MPPKHADTWSMASFARIRSMIRASSRPCANCRATASRRRRRPRGCMPMPTCRCPAGASCSSRWSSRGWCSSPAAARRAGARPRRRHRYGAALMGVIGATVTAVESEPALLDIARAAMPAAVRPARSRWCRATRPTAMPPARPIRVLIEGGVHDVPRAVQEQLAEGGRLVAVGLAGGTPGRALLLRRIGGTFTTTRGFDAHAPALPPRRGARLQLLTPGPGWGAAGCRVPAGDAGRFRSAGTQKAPGGRRGSGRAPAPARPAWQGGAGALRCGKTLPTCFGSGPPCGLPAALRGTAHRDHQPAQAPSADGIAGALPMAAPRAQTLRKHSPRPIPTTPPCSPRGRRRVRWTRTCRRRWPAGGPPW